MILYDLFYKRFGVRLPTQMLKPMIHYVDKFEFPRRSLWHYVNHDGIQLGPDTNEYVLRDIKKKIFVEHQYELQSFLGTPRKLGIALVPLARKYHMQNKRFRLTPNVVVNPSDPHTLAVVNYSLLPKAYRYARSIYSEYYRWKNIETTAWKKIAELAEQSDYHQFYFVNLPETLFSVSRLNTSMEKFDQLTLKRFNTKEALFFLEFWKWLSASHRQESLLGNYSQLVYDKINLVFMDQGSWIVYNLGKLNSWRFVQGESPESQKTKIKPEMMQRQFLRAMMFLMALRRGPEAQIDEESGELIEADENTPISEDQAESTSLEEYETLLGNLDKDLKQLEVIDKEIESYISADKPVEESEELTNDRQSQKRKETHIGENGQPDTEVKPQVFEKVSTLQESMQARIDDLADTGMMDAADYRRRLKLLEKFQNLPSPRGNGKTLVEDIIVTPEDLNIGSSAQTPIGDLDTVLDKSMLKSSLLDFDKRYIEQVLPKDVLGMAASTQKAGFTIADYQTEVIEDIIGKYEVHTLRINPIEGVAGTMRFRIPVIEKDGTFTANNVKYTLRKARRDLPIRKITPSRVALSSYYGKTFVIRSEKKANDYGQWLHNKISEIALNDPTRIQRLHPSNVFDHLFLSPRVYSELSKTIKSFEANGFEWFFDHHDRHKVFSEEQLKTYETEGRVLIGLDKEDRVLVMDKNSTIYQGEKGHLSPLGTIEDVLGIDALKAPVPYAEARIFSKNIPVGLVLAYKYGWSKLIEMLGCEYRTVGAGQRLNLQNHEYPIYFSDETWIFSKEDPISTMVLAGLSQYDKTTRNYSVHVFDKPGVYLKLLEQHNLNVRYLREIDLLDEMFVDPITEQILKEMGEPITYRSLLIRSCELLLTDYHKDPLDMAEMRICGYERIAGSVYTEIVNAVRDHRGRPSRRSTTIDLNPYAVWKRITSDPAVMPSNDLNPIENIKEQEAVTYSGHGGRSSRAMVKSSRAFHPNDLGVISEATKDSSDVAINTYLVADPQFTSLRGLTKQKSVEQIDPASLVSTSALVSVAGDQDSAQRLNMVSIQQSHSIACNGYEAMPVRTGYEQIIAQRAGESFSHTADMAGKVLQVSKDAIKVEYEDGSVKSYPLGRKFGRSPDSVIPHELTTDHREGQTFEKGEVLAYNQGFFTRDQFNPKTLLWKNGVLARVVLMETRQTHEDASSISLDLANKLKTKITTIKNVVLNFDQHIRNVLPVGSAVEHDSVLCYIEDSVTAASKLFDEESLSTLLDKTNQAPRAKKNGVIEKIEVFYHGDIEDMSDSLAAITTQSNRQLRQSAIAQGKKPYTGQVDESFRIEGNPLQLDSLVIRFYITTEVANATGDKVVYANQLKSIVSEVMDYPVTTESGLKIDAVFGAQSIFNRIVNSAFIIGTTNTLLGVIGKKAAKIYRGQV